MQTASGSRLFAAAFLALCFLGFLDSAYLTIEHYRGVAPPCSFLEGCERVTTSPYSRLLGVPVALAGALYYLALLLLTVFALEEGSMRAFRAALALAPLGFLATLWFVFAQAFILRAFCLFCLFSAATSTALFMLYVASWRSGGREAARRKAEVPRLDQTMGGLS
jgi:uncharacterized membrane protein